MSAFVLWLILAPIVVAIGYMITWINKANNPFWVYKQLKKLDVGAVYWAKGSADRFPKDSLYYRPNHRTAVVTGKNVSFWRGKVYFNEYLDDKPIVALTELTASDFFGFYTPE